MSNQDTKDPSAYISKIPAQTQDGLPGLDADMETKAEHTRLEFHDRDGKPYLKEFEGRGLLVGKKAILTGADSGIGRSAAILMSREGADVTIFYLPVEQRDADEVKAIIEKEGRKCLLVSGDIKQESDAKNLVARHMEAYGALDILVNNASIQKMVESIADLPMDQVKETYETNIIGMIQLAKYAVPHIPRGGVIINTSSVTGLKGSKALIDYSSTKGAILSFTRSLALQLAPRGIRVNSVAPGPVWTPLQPAARPADNIEGWAYDATPLWGRPGQPAEQGAIYVFLASPWANSLTGQTIHSCQGQWLGA